LTLSFSPLPLSKKQNHDSLCILRVCLSSYSARNILSRDKIEVDQIDEEAIKLHRFSSFFFTFIDG
jgi:hypothetical protein